MGYTGVATLFQALVSNLQLSAAHLADAQGKHQRVRRCLNLWYYNLDSGSANSMLVGSYGKDTEISPPSDIDILFELPASVRQRFRERSGNVQSQLLQEVKGVLQRSFSSTDIRGDGQIVSVPFSTYKVEVLPAFRLVSSQYEHADANGGGKWRTTDPVSEKNGLVASNKSTGGKTIHLIKLAKAWRRTRGVKIKSFVLELAAQRFLAPWSYNTSGGATTGYGYYDFMMRDFFPWLLQQKNSYWYVPGPGVYDTVAVGDTWEAKARFAESTAAAATAHGAEDRILSAKAEWRRIFGDYVPA